MRRILSYETWNRVTKKRPSLEADSSSAGQEIPLILCGLEVQYDVNTSPPLANTLSQNNPMDTIKILFNFIIPPTSTSFELSVSLSFPHQDPICTFLVAHTCHMPSPSHSFWFDHPIKFGEKISWRASLCSFLHYPFTLSLLGPPSSETPAVYILPATSETVFHAHIKQETKL